MKKSTLIAAISLMIIGIVMFTGVMAVYGFDFRKLSTVEYVENTYSFDEKINSISIDTDTADVIFRRSEDNTCKIVANEEEKMTHKVKLEAGKLYIEIQNNKAWYDHIGINLRKTSLEIYLPQDEYQNIDIDISTGDVNIGSDFAFEDININGNTGDIRCSVKRAENITITTSTGDIILNSVNAENIKLAQSTGESVISDVNCKNLEITGSTGDIELVNVIAQNKFIFETDTGDVEFSSCDAGEIYIKTSTGDVEGSLLTGKLFSADTSTGEVEVPRSSNGGKCEIRTSTGDIEVYVK